MSSIIILSGGSSSEREVSLKSGQAVEAALARKGYPTKIIDYADGVEAHKQELLAADAVFPALHGKGGEDGELQKQLEDLGISFVGSGSEASALCMHKWEYKQHIQNAAKTPRGELVDQRAFWMSDLSNKPFVLKPVDGGSSVNTFIIRDMSHVDKDAINGAFSKNPQMLLEELISGHEMTVGVLANQPLPPVEIIPPEGGEFDYENKYNNDDTLKPCPPINIPPDAQERAKELALKVHQACGCRDLSRTDMIYTPEGDIYVIETNTLPGMTDHSLFPKEAAAIGIPFDDLIDQLTKMALVRES